MQNAAFILTPKSANHKTGPIAVSTSCKSTCPDACPLKKGGGCYGEYGPLLMHWKRRNDNALKENWGELLHWLQTEVSEGSYFRHNQIGDLMGQNNVLDGIAAAELVFATSHLHAFTYTHYPVLASDAGGRQDIADQNRRVVEWMIEHGFVVNISANSINHADAIIKSGIKCPMVAAVQGNFITTPVSRSPRGVPVVTCPAVLKDDITCKQCKLCARAGRTGIIVFPSHGSGKKHADATIDAWDEKYKGV